MRALRRWSVRHAGALARGYAIVERAMLGLRPLWWRLGHERLEPPFQSLERAAKGLLFDCRMCGRCVLSSTGMACPMNCPKALRNGPCGGVRPDGRCEVDATMRCVWVEAWEGAERMGEAGRAAIRELQPATDHALQGRSAWLELLRRNAAGPHA
jgi:hypothetical protein